MIDRIENVIISGRLLDVEDILQEAVEACIRPEEIVDTMISAMNVVGEKFQSNEIFVPEMLLAAKTMQRGMRVLAPLLSCSMTKISGKCIIGTVAGDLHDIGKNLVALMIESAGIEVIDLGVDVFSKKLWMQ